MTKLDLRVFQSEWKIIVPKNFLLFLKQTVYDWLQGKLLARYSSVELVRKLGSSFVSEGVPQCCQI